MSHPLINELVRLQAEIDAAETMLGDLYLARTAIWKRGVALGVPSVEMANACDVSPARVSQEAPRPKPAPAATGTPVERESASERLAGASCAIPPIESVLGADTLSGRYSSRKLAPYGWRVTMWADLDERAYLAEIGLRETLAGDTLADVLSAARWTKATRIFLIGGAPSAEGEHGDNGIRAWFLTDPGPGWKVAKHGHHLSDPRSPTARYEFTDGLVVEVMRTAAWWGETDAGLSESREAWHQLQDKIRATFDDSARLLATPAITGRDLWQRTIGPKTQYPVLSDEIRELIHATAGQGRIELLEPPGGRADHKLRPRSVEIPSVHVRDGRLMYAALTWGMPCGSPLLLTQGAIELMPDAQLHAAIMGRSRWHVIATVPRDWAKPFGLLMAPREGGKGWRYPADPGEMFETWCDGSELALARSQGWHVQILGGMTFKEGKPLNVWTQKLLDIWRHFEAAPDPSIGRLAQRAIRAMILFAIGAFASRGRDATYTLHEDQADQVPAGVAVHRAGEMLVWTQPVPATSWSQQLAHPEWSATIWARARTRLLAGPGADGPVGALHLPKGIDVIAFRTDALVLTGDPGWSDDGKPGRLRPDGELPGPMDWPHTETEMLQLKTAAQNRNTK